MAENHLLPVPQPLDTVDFSDIIRGMLLQLPPGYSFRMHVLKNFLCTLPDARRFRTYEEFNQSFVNGMLSVMWSYIDECGELEDFYQVMNMQEKKTALPLCGRLVEQGVLPEYESALKNLAERFKSYCAGAIKDLS